MNGTSKLGALTLLLFVAGCAANFEPKPMQEVPLRVAATVTKVSLPFASWKDQIQYARSAT